MNKKTIHFYKQNSRFKLHYEYVICSDLLLKQNYTSILELPSLKKIVLNATSSDYVSDKKNLISTFLGLELVTGQKATLTCARKSLAPFKIREKQAIGCKVTLRKSRMYNFLIIFLTLVLPRLRDFHGISKISFDGSGNFSLGFTYLLLFPQLEQHYDIFQNFKGLNINFITNSSKIKNKYLLYSAFQFPISH